MYKMTDFAIENIPTYDIHLIPNYQNMFMYTAVYQRQQPERIILGDYRDDPIWA